MIRKLLMIACLLCSVDMFAQSRYEMIYDAAKFPDQPEKYNGRESYKMPGDPMPPFKVITLPWVEFFFEKDANGKQVEKQREVVPMRTITNADIPADKNLIIMMFNPGCDHCQAQTDSFTKHIDLFKNTQLLLVAGPMIGENMGHFAKAHRLNEYPQIWMGLDYDNLISKAFLYYSLPQLCIYGKDKKLVRMLSGGTPIDSLGQYIR